MKKLLITLAVAGATVLTGCSSNYDAAEQVRANYEAQLELERLKAENAKLESAKKDELIDSIPEWVNEPPKSDGFGVYGIGIGESSSFKLALDKSMLVAKNSAAEQMNSELSSLVQSYQAERGQEVSEDSFSSTIEQLVSEVNVAGYTVVEKELVNVDNKYYSYTLIHLPYDEFNKALKQQDVKVESEVVRSAFEELERKVDKRKENARKAKEKQIKTVVESVESQANTEQ